MNARIKKDCRPIWATLLFTFMSLTTFCQSDLVVGSQYQLNIQRQNGNADAYLLHNAQYHSSGGTFSWNTSHPSFGSRGIKLSYVDGIHFFADNQTSTTGATFTPPTRFFIGNSGRIGIGTTAPASALEVVGPNTGTGPTIHAAGGGDLILNPGGSLFLDGNYSYGSGNYIRPIGGSNTQGFFTAGQERMRIAANGMIGIGTTTPSTKLSFGTNYGSRMVSLYDATSDWYGFGIGSYQMRLQVGTANARFSFFAGDASEIMTVKGSGNVGIGTTSPDQRLTVKGKVHAEEVIIDLSVPAPDYVFEKSYDLKPLDEVRKFIDENKHLPEVPSAKEMEKDGVKVGEMEMVLLKKIEEVTLHLIEQNNEMRKLKSVVTDQAQTIESLKQKIKTLEK